MPAAGGTSPSSPLSHPPTPGNLLSVFPWVSGQATGWGVRAWEDVILAPHGTVSQNYIFMLATTV